MLFPGKYMTIMMMMMMMILFSPRKSKLVGYRVDCFQPTIRLPYRSTIDGYSGRLLVLCYPSFWRPRRCGCAHPHCCMRGWGQGHYSRRRYSVTARFDQLFAAVLPATYRPTMRKFIRTNIGQRGKRKKRRQS